MADNPLEEAAWCPGLASPDAWLPLPLHLKELTSSIGEMQARVPRVVGGAGFPHRPGSTPGFKGTFGGESGDPEMQGLRVLGEQTPPAAPPPLPTHRCTSVYNTASCCSYRMAFLILKERKGVGLQMLYIC